MKYPSPIRNIEWPKNENYLLLNECSRRMQPPTIAIAEPTIGCHGERSLQCSMRRYHQLHVARTGHKCKSSRRRSERDTGRGGREIEEHDG